MSVARAVTVIPPTVKLHQTGILSNVYKKKVAAYARVSTDNEEQLTSYEAQVDYYTRHIKNNSQWEFIAVYTDEGISGTSTKNREGFKCMIADALNGKIDLILTKSISRFARNTVDTLTTVRKLKEKGVEVYFEKENIYTLDSKGELLITIMSSLAQEESRSLSENITWGHRKRFADGKVTMPYKRFLGYEKGEDGQPKIVEKEAAIVRLIYMMFLDGKPLSSIAKHLTKESIPTPGGKTIWQTSVVESILTNEKYKGDAILQKSFTVDFLTKKQKINEGEVPQYYVENSHPPIISPELFDYVQNEILRRKGNRYSKSCFSGRIICGDCGSVYGSKVWHSTSKYRRIIWQCNGKFKVDKKCSTPHLYDKQLQDLFVQAMNSFIKDRNSIMATYKEIIQSLTDNKALETEEDKLQEESDIIYEMMRKMVEENAQKAFDQSEYQLRYDSLAAKYSHINDRLSEVTKTIDKRNVKQKELERFINILKKQDDILTEFNEELWNSIVHQLVIHSATEFTFIFKDGTELPWKIEDNLR